VTKWPYRWGTAKTSADDGVAGRFAFPASSSTLAVAGRVLEVFPCRPSPPARWAALARRLRVRRIPPSWSSPLLQSALVSARTPRGLRRGPSSSSLGIRPLGGPLGRSTVDASTPGSSRSLRSGGCEPPNPVPPSCFLNTSAACSASGLRVCCAPLPALGFRAFPGARPTCSVAVGTNLPFPAQ
jgi:hypothetical protein